MHLTQYVVFSADNSLIQKLNLSPTEIGMASSTIKTTENLRTTNLMATGNETMIGQLPNG